MFKSLGGKPAQVCLAILLLLFLAAPAFAQGPLRVVILPFSVNAKEDLSFLAKGVRDMMATRLAWQDKVTVMEHDLVKPVMERVKPPYNDAKARKLGQEMGAQVVVFGSMTVFGKAVSLDARVVKVGKDEPALTAFIQAPNQDEVIPRINDFSQRINAEIFKRPDAVAAQKAKAEAAKPASARKQESGEKSSLDSLPENISPLNPLFRRTLTGVESDRYWRSPRIPHNITSLCVADVDLDGKNELIVLLPDRLRIYRLSGDHFAMVYEMRNGPSGHYLFVDCIDADGDGRPEIYVSSVWNKLVRSFVGVYRDSTFRITKRDLPYYFRVQNNPEGKGQILLGQEAHLDQPFAGTVSIMKYAGGDYQKDRTLKLPRLANIYNFCLADLNGSGKPNVVLLDGDNHLRVYSTNGEELWVSGGIYASSAKYLEFSPAAGKGAEDQEDLEYLPTRILAVDLNGDGRQEIVVVKNDDRAGGVFDRLKAYYQGTIFSLEWNGMQLVQRWRTQRISGYLTDYAVADVGNVGRPALVIGIGRKMLSGFFEKGVSNVVAFTLKVKSITKKPPKNKGL